MAKTNNVYILPQDNRTKTAILTAAKASQANITDAVKIAAGGANGSLVKSVWALPRDTMAAANKLSLYLYDGATTYLIDSVLMAAYTYAATTATPTTTFAKATDATPIYLPSGWGLYAGAATALAAGIAVSALIEDY